MSGDERESQGDERTESARDIWREVIGAGVLVFGLVLAASLLAGVIPFVSRSLYVIVAAIFLYLPWWWIDEHLDYDLEDFGLSTERLWRNVGWGALLSVLTLIPFAVGFWWWETKWVGHSFEFQTSNYLQWAPEWEGEPQEWGRETGVWVWTRDASVNIGARAADREPLLLQVSADRSFRPRVSGPASVEHLGGTSESENGHRWRITVQPRQTRARIQITPSSPGTADYPTSIKIRAIQPKALPIRAGPGGERVDGGFSLDRGLKWLWLWLMTQVFFIALPEEFFYRGYFQTRVRHALEQGRREAGDAPETRSWWGISEENLIASLVFGLGHLLIPIGGQILATRITVAFPAILFGWLRDKTGTITASVVYHAACNMMVLVAAPHFF